MAGWRMTRLLAAHDGNPVHAGDGDDRQLVVDEYGGSSWAAHRPADSETSTTAPILSASAEDWEQLRALSKAEFIVEQLANGYLRVRATDGSTMAMAYFTGDFSDDSAPFLLGEVTA